MSIKPVPAPTRTGSVMHFGFRFIPFVLCLAGLLPCPGIGQVAAQTSPATDADWPGFRGPQGNGHATARNLPVEVDEQTNVAWQVELPGRGWSSPVIVDGQIWLTTAIEVEATGEALEKKMATADIQGMSAYSEVQLQALQVDAETGRIIRTVDLFTIADPPLIHSLNSFASPTPVADQKNVYVHFGTFGTAAIDQKSGQVVWKTQDYPLEHQTGPGSSPILHNGLLILHCDGCDLQYVLALDAETGQQAWRTERSGEMHENPMFKKAFCTPVVVMRGGAPQLVSPAANWVYGYDPATGEELWKLGYGQLGFSNVAMPVVRDQMIYVCSCFTRSKMLAIDFSGTQPVVQDNVKWTYSKQVPNMPSPVEIDGLIYFTDDRGIATCLDAETGEARWQGRLGGGFSSSPLYADGKIYFGNQDGELFVVNPDAAELEILATSQLDSSIMASPAAVGEALFVRTAKKLYRFENRRDQPGK